MTSGSPLFRARRFGRRSAAGLRFIRDASLDVVNGALGRRDPMVPPARLQFVGAGDYRAVGEHVLELLIDIAHLKPSERILDIGCGTGRVALALLDYLNEQGSYEGFDVSVRGIDWATKTIAQRNPRFRFVVADVQNDHYNPSGQVAPAEYLFPYGDDAFDVAFATSVFTHMRAPEVRRYLSEIERTLRPGGRALMTFCILSDASRAAIAHGTARYSFAYGEGDEHFEYRDRLVEGVAYDEANIRRWIAEAGLTLEAPIHYGSWASAAGASSFQDVVLAIKPA